MRAVRLNAFGGDPVVDDVPPPSAPGVGEVIVDVSAVGVGAWDVGVAAGDLSRFVDQDLPATMGAELAGRISAVGPEVEGFELGDRVMANPGIVGAWAERARIPAASCGPAPETFSDAEAATTPVRCLTAWQALDALDLAAGSCLLVVGGGGGVGLAAVEIARQRGLRTIVVAAERELEATRRLGAEAAADYRGDWIRELSSAVGGSVDAALDLVGGDSLDRALQLLRDGGRVVTTIAGAADAPAPRGIEIEFLPMRSDTATLRAIADLADAGGITAAVARTYGLADAAAALRDQRSKAYPGGRLALLLD